MSSILDKLASVWESIVSLPGLIWDKFKDAFDTVSNWLRELWLLVLDLPDLLIQGIKDIFIPDGDELKEDLKGLIDSLNHTFNLAIDSKEWMVDSFHEEAIPDERHDYSIPGVGNFNLTFFDASYLKRGVEYFRPIIRGFIVLLLCFYHYKQVLTFIGQDPGIYNTTVSSIEAKQEKAKKGG